MRDHPPGFGLLGPLTVRDLSGTRIPVGPPMQQALLGCFLAAANRQVSRERLVGDLWGPTPPPSARAALNNQISSLRRTLAAQAAARLRTVAGGYVLEVPEAEVDVLVLEQRLLAVHDARDRGDWGRVAEETAAALTLWRGTPLDGLTALAECEWHAPFLARCESMRMQALEWSVEADYRLGRYQALTSRLAALVNEFPLNEAFHAYLMRCLALAGRRADALEVYQKLRRTLIGELGIEPGELTRSVQARILTELPGPDGGDATAIAADPLAVADSPAAAGLLPAAGAPTAADSPTAAGAPAGADSPHTANASHATTAPDDSPEPAPPIPAQLPADVPDFIGRDAELEAVAAVLSAATHGGRNVVAVTGMGGVGKSALAVRAARAAQRLFPDGQLYVDLHGFGKTPAREPHEVLAGFLASLSGPGGPGSARPIPEHLGDRAALLRSTLADRRVLLMIDNARDAEQVLPLLPGDGRCAVVVTSRSTLTDLPGAVHVNLHPLDADGQHTLLKALCGEDRVADDPDGAAAILRACGGLPLALRISAARLASRPAWSLSTLARQLDGARGRLPALVAGHLALQSTFSTSYFALRDSEQPHEREAARAFRLLGLWPGHEFTPNAAAALLDRPVDDAMTLLEFLADAHLVQTPQPLRYRLHDLLGEYAAERAAEEEDAAEAATLRLMTWYLLALEEAGLRTGVGRNRAPRLEEPPPAPLPEFPDAEVARRWCVEELANLKQAVHEAATSSRPDFAWRLAVWMFAYGASYWWTGEWDECLQTGFTTAQTHNDLLGQAWSLTRMGIRYGMAFRSEEAVVMFEATLLAMEKLEDDAGRASTLMNLSLAHQQAGRYDTALHYARDAWELYEHVHGDIEDAYLIAAFGTALLMGEEYEEAESFLRTAQTLLEDRGNATAAATNLANLGDALRGLNRREEALALLTQSLELRRKVGDIGGLSNGLAIKGRIHAHFNELDAAGEALREALRLAVEHQLPASMADHARDRLADVERRMAARAVGC